MRFFKLYKFLFEDEKYKNISTNSKVAFCIYSDLISQNKNIKRDNEGKVYIQNPREYLMKTLNVSRNTVTKIHKELKSVDLIIDKWEDVGKPNILYLKNCETPKQQVIHKTCAIPKVEEKKIEVVEETKKVEEQKTKIEEAYVEEFTMQDIEDANRFLNTIGDKRINKEFNKLIKNVRLNAFNSIEQEMLKIGLRILTIVYKDDERYKLMINLNTALLEKAINRCKRKKRGGRNIGYILAECILNVVYSSVTESYWDI